MITCPDIRGGGWTFGLNNIHYSNNDIHILIMIFICNYCCCHGNTMARKCTEKCRAVGFYRELTGEKETVEDASESDN